MLLSRLSGMKNCRATDSHMVMMDRFTNHFQRRILPIFSSLRLATPIKTGISIDGMPKLLFTRVNENHAPRLPAQLLTGRVLLSAESMRLWSRLPFTKNETMATAIYMAISRIMKPMMSLRFSFFRNSRPSCFTVAATAASPFLDVFLLVIYYPCFCVAKIRKTIISCLLIKWKLPVAIIRKMIIFAPI